MNRTMAVLLAVTMASASAGAEPIDAMKKVAQAQQATAALQALFKSSDEAGLKLNPQAALQRGDLRYADQFGDLITDEFLAASEAQARADLRAIRGIDRDVLSDVDRIAYDVFAYQAELAVRAHDTGVAKINQQMPIDHYFGQHIAFASFSSGDGVAPFNTVADYESGLKRIDGFVLYLGRAQAMMRRGIAQGHVHAQVIAEKVIRQLDEAIRGEKESPFLGPLKKFPPAMAEADKARFTAAYRAALATKITPAYRALKTFMEREYLPAARTGAPGLTVMRDGAKRYAYALAEHTTTTMTPEEIHALGLSEVARIRAEMEAVKTKVGFAGTLDQFFAHLRTDAKFKFATAEALLDGYRKIQTRVEPILPRLFARLPKCRLEIKPVPPEQASSSGASYTPGTPDCSRPGVFYVNTSDLPSQTSPRMTSLFLHEGMPGHHLQGSVTQEDERLPEFLRFGWNTGYGEGWALYAEHLGAEMGVYDDPYQYFGRLDTEIFRAVRLVVDTGLHAKGWSREQAIAYMSENTPHNRAFIEQEVDRYIVWPGQATAYKIGELVIRKLRLDAEKKLGPKFDVRAFHEQVLDTGALPLSVLERKIDDWDGR